MCCRAGYRAESGHKRTRTVRTKIFGGRAPQRHLTHVRALLWSLDEVSAAGIYFEPHPRTWAGLLDLAVHALERAVDTFSIPALLAFVAGVVRTARTTPFLLVLLLPVPILFGLLFVPTGFAILRYYLIVTPIVDGFAAHGILWLRQTKFRPLWIPTLLAVCGLRFLVGVDLSLAQLDETRVAAGHWIEAHALPGERIEYFGASQKLPPLPAVAGCSAK